MISGRIGKERPRCTTSSSAAAPSSTGPAGRPSPATWRSTGERIDAVGGKLGPGRREIDADGLLVTPGWVDVHTHYDGQAMWDPILAPSSWHGVTTVMFGNCGVGFAPVRPEHRGALMDLMEGVEEIPGAAMAEGLDWEWESFPDFLDALERQPARHRHRGAARASPVARLCHGRPRHPPRGCDHGRHRRDAPPHHRGAARRRVRLHHLAHRFAQDHARRDGPGALCRGRGAIGHRLGAWAWSVRARSE